jgi:hypothetical protein
MFTCSGERDGFVNGEAGRAVFWRGTSLNNACDAVFGNREHSDPDEVTSCSSNTASVACFETFAIAVAQGGMPAFGHHQFGAQSKLGWGLVDWRESPWRGFSLATVLSCVETHCDEILESSGT